MHLSGQALKLLNEGNIAVLQALPFEQLVAEEVNQEFLDCIDNPKDCLRTGDSVAEIFIDEVSLESLVNACTLSSGQIYSQTMAQQLFSRDLSQDVICPKSKKTLKRNIGGTGLPYVLLPKVDEAVQFYREIYAQSKPSSRHTSQPYIPAIAPIAEEKACNSNRKSLLSEKGFFKDKKQEEVTPCAPPFSLLTVGTFLLKVAKNKLRVVIKLTDNLADCDYQLISFFSEALPPESRVDLRGNYKSYSMSKDTFGRCWKAQRNNIFEMDLWFPSASTGIRTFSDCHLNELLVELYGILGLPQNVDTNSEIEQHTIANIAPKTYVTALPEMPTTLEKIIQCCQLFIEHSQRVARGLGFTVNDTVINHGHTVEPSRVTGSGVFGSSNTSTTTLTFSATHIPR